MHSSFVGSGAQYGSLSETKVGLNGTGRTARTDNRSSAGQKRELSLPHELLKPSSAVDDVPLSEVSIRGTEKSTALPRSPLDFRLEPNGRGINRSEQGKPRP
jgi:hypothetical protein